jgi:hypothetical protein
MDALVTGFWFGFGLIVFIAFPYIPGCSSARFD